jgi:MtN3 and saliva related transmembrane protein
MSAPPPDWTAWVGYAAAALTTGSFLPQVLHTWRTRDVSGISLGMYAVLVAGIVTWLVYGVLIGDRPLVVANVVTLALAGSVLAMKLMHTDRR